MTHYLKLISVLSAGTLLGCTQLSTAPPLAQPLAAPGADAAVLPRIQAVQRVTSPLSEVDGLFATGQSAYGAGQLALAEAHFGQVLALQPLHFGALNALALGDAGAAAVGVDVAALRRTLLLAACAIVGAAVSVGGLIGFVGLVVPHVLRLMLGPDHRRLLPTAVLAGAAFLALCDAGTRLLFTPLGTDLPVGAVTAGLGGPLFLYLLWRERERLV